MSIANDLFEIVYILCQWGIDLIDIILRENIIMTEQNQ